MSNLKKKKKIYWTSTEDGNKQKEAVRQIISTNHLKHLEYEVGILWDTPAMKMKLSYNRPRAIG